MIFKMSPRQDFNLDEEVLDKNHLCSVLVPNFQ